MDFTINNKDFYIWFAGFWEGEGSLFRVKSRNYTMSVCQAIREDRTTEECFKIIQKKLGGYLHFYKHQNERYLVRYDWFLYERLKIKAVLYKILPYLLIRKKDVLNALINLEKMPIKKTRFFPTETEINIIRNSNGYRDAGRKLNRSHHTIKRYLKKSFV